jgi:hypothetical protein
LANRRYRQTQVLELALMDVADLFIWGGYDDSRSWELSFDRWSLEDLRTRWLKSPRARNLNPRSSKGIESNSWSTAYPLGRYPLLNVKKSRLLQQRKDLKPLQESLKRRILRDWKLWITCGLNIWLTILSNRYLLLLTFLKVSSGRILSSISKTTL